MNACQVYVVKAVSRNSKWNMKKKETMSQVVEKSVKSIEMFAHILTGNNTLPLGCQRVGEGNKVLYTVTGEL